MISLKVVNEQFLLERCRKAIPLVDSDAELQYLIEVMYKNSPYLKQAEALFKQLMDEVKLKPGANPASIKSYNNINTSVDTMKILEKIAVCFNKTFNTDIKFFLDQSDSFNGLAYILINTEDRKDLYKLANELYKENKDGIHFLKVKKCTIYIQTFLIKMLKTQNFSSRHLVAIICHEIAHKLFIRVNCEELQKGHLKAALMSFITILGVSPGAVLTSQDNECVTGSRIIIQLVTMIALSVTTGIAVRAFFNVKAYSRSEGNCDQNAIRNGYGLEIFEFFVYIERYFSKNDKILSTNSKFFRIKKLFNADYQRRDIMYKTIQQEINNPNNTPAERENLKGILKSMDELISKHS